MESEASDSEETKNNQFRPFTRDSLKAIEAKIAEEQHQKKNDEESQPDSSLEQGSRLPFRFWGIFPLLLAYTPLQDIDPFYSNKRTFIVISRRKNILRFSATNALWILSPFNPVRLVAIYILAHPLFTVFMNITIIINAFLLIPPATFTINTIKMVCIGIYTLEIILKVMARGFILQPFTYLRDAWNWLDFVVTALVYTAMSVDLGDVAVFESLRMLRLLHIVAVIPGCKIFVKSLMESLKNLKDVLILVILVLSVLATLGLQLYMGVLTQKCVRHFPLDGSWGNLTEENWESFVSSEENWYFDVDRNEYPLCGNSSGAGMCPSDHTCLQGYGQNPNYGYTNFDKFGWALLTSFQLMTQDYWESVYQPVLNSAGPWHILFFLVAIFFISINFLNLILASVTKCYSELLKCNEEEEAERQAVSKRADKDTTTKSAWDCCPTIQKFVALFIFNPFIQLFIVVCIILNTVFMALDHHNMTIDLERILVYGNYFFVLIFVIETILKIIALNPKCYFQNNWNRLDFIVIALALFALFAANAGGLLGGFIILRIFTLLRLFKLVKFLPTLNFLLSVMSKSLSAVANLTLVTFVTVFIFALLGMHSFGINYIDNYDRFPGYELPRWNFTDLMHSFMLIFRVFCGEWVESMWDGMLVGDISVIYFFLGAVIVCRFVMANLFLSVILCNFESCKVSPPRDGDVDGIVEAFKRVGCFIKWNRTKIEESTGKVDEDNLDKSKRVDESLGHNDSDDHSINGELQLELEENPDNMTNKDKHPPPCFPESCYKKLPKGRINKESSFWRTWSYLRRKIFDLVESKYFEGAVITIIIFSSLALTLEDIFITMRPQLQNILHHLDAVFVGIFVAEMLVMWLGVGFRKYFTNPWYFLDFLVLTILLISCFSGNQILKAMRILRLLRVLRPMLCYKTMKIVTNTLTQSKSGICSALFLCLLIWLFFAILGVQLFAGKFFKCIDDNYTVASFEIIPDFYSCMFNNFTWENSPMNFDHVGNAYLSLFEVAIFKGWIQIMNDAIDSREIDNQPIREVNIYMYLYFIAFIIFGSFFTMNLFIGVILHNYKEQEAKVRGWLAWNKGTQNRLHNAMNLKASKTPLKAIPKPKWKPQLKVLEMVTNKKFEMVMLVVIGLNILTMATDHYQAKEGFIRVLNYVNLIFIAIFSFECLLKMFALRGHYFTDSWNWFDLIVTTSTVFQLFMSDILEKYLISPTLLALFRVIRVVKIKRCLRSVKWVKGIRILYLTLSASRPSLFCVCFLSFLVMFIYAIFGMFLFMHVSDENGRNFQTFGGSMIFLFQVSTFAGWDGCLDVIRNRANPVVGMTYLLSYFFICFLIFSTYVAVIVNNYIRTIDEVERGLTEDDFDMFYETWRQFDPEATQYIPYSQLSDFLDKLEPPFQMRKPNRFKIISMDIPICRGDLIFHSDVLDCLVHEFFHVECDLERTVEVRINNREDYKPVSSTLVRQHEEQCAKLIQGVWRRCRCKNVDKSDASGGVESQQTVVVVE